MHKRTVVLTAEEMEIIEAMGMTPAEFARGKLHLEGEKYERAKIVNWLKSLATPENGFLPRTLANWIEDEMHLESEENEDHQI